LTTETTEKIKQRHQRSVTMPVRKEGRMEGRKEVQGQ
jgi:hypothetical protein